MKKMLQKLLAATLSTLLLLIMAIPALAIGQSVSPDSVRAIQPRYSNIYQLDCDLSVDSKGTAIIDAWVDFVYGNKCTIKVTLERNGSTVKTWTTSSNNGTVSIEKTVTGLASGKYQAIMYVTCGSDSDIVSSGTKTI